MNLRKRLLLYIMDFRTKGNIELYKLEIQIIEKVFAQMNSKVGKIYVN